MIQIPKGINSRDLRRGEVYQAGLPHILGRPLRFVEESENDLYRVIKKDFGLEGKVNPQTGATQAVEYSVVTPLKMRPCLVIQNDALNCDEKYDFVIVLPIATVPEERKTLPIMKRMIEKNDVSRFHYIENSVYITVDDPHRIYKNLLFEVNESSLKFDKRLIDMDEIMKKYARCFKITKIRECEECERNCKNCEFRIAASNK
jgi:hypothetical protein